MVPHLARGYAGFDAQGFIDFATNDLDNLELKERSSQITDALRKFLPEEFRAATKILIKAMAPEAPPGQESDPELGISGFPMMSLTLYVALYGQHDPKFSVALLKEMTKSFTSEFAIRYYLIEHRQLTLDLLSEWVNDESEHVRRLVSEGSRPRLPWAMQLTEFVADPSPVIALLEQLKDDESEYVRRSVANNLNDIAKDHPELVVEVCTRWMNGASKERAALVRHGLRSLVKSGDLGALNVIGYGPAQIELTGFRVITPEVVFGDALEFEVEVTSTSSETQSLMIDYVVHHMKANGRTAPKVFKWKKTKIKSGASLVATRRHPMKPITTRRYYPGLHRVELQINGELYGAGEFILEL